MSWEILLFLTSAIHGVILSVFFLLDRKNNRKAFLGVYLLSFSITILYYVNYWTQMYQLPQAILWIGVVSSWLMPFSFYCYMTDNASAKKLWSHLLIPAVFTIYWFISLNIETPDGFNAVARTAAILTQITLFIYYGVLTFQKKITRQSKPHFLSPVFIFSDWFVSLLFVSFNGVLQLETGLYHMRRIRITHIRNYLDE